MNRNTQTSRWIHYFWILAVLYACPSAAKADGSAPADRPLKTATGPLRESSNAEEGVSPAQKEQARHHYVTGNEHLRTASFQKAVHEYERALRYWKHARIYYNLGIALINLDRPVDAYQAISAAQHAPEQLGAGLHEQASNYLRLLGRQIGEIEVICANAGTRVSMNGQEIFRGPGKVRRRVPIGNYHIVATNPGFLPAESSVMILPNKQVAAEISMLARDEAVIEERLIRRAWIPWTMAGVGAALLATGGLLHYQAYDLFGRADERFAQDCQEGCMDSDQAARSALGDMDTAGTMQAVAFPSYVVGGALVISGLTLAYLNQPKVTHIERSNVRTWVTPVVSTDMVGLQGAWTF